MTSVLGWIVSLQTIGGLVLGAIVALLWGQTWSMTPWAKKKRDRERAQRIMEGWFFG
jgi:hypothetical protein